jgi:molybdopterin-guanine dinucleotide biosynthesis protein MobB
LKMPKEQPKGWLKAANKGGSPIKPVVSFVGGHNCGKTTILVKVIDALVKMGIEVAVVKHAAHNLSIIEGKDSDSLFAAGAKVVFTSSPNISLMYRRHAVPNSLSEIIEIISDGVDMVITEGYKSAATPKVEVMRKELVTEPMKLDNVIARVTDFVPGNLPDAAPLFSFSQQQEIAKFLVEWFNIKN